MLTRLDLTWDNGKAMEIPERFWDDLPHSIVKIRVLYDHTPVSNLLTGKSNVKAQGSTRFCSEKTDQIQFFANRTSNHARRRRNKPSVARAVSIAADGSGTAPTPK